MKVAGVAAVTGPAADAAVMIVDAILRDDGPMRHGTTASSAAGLEWWRGSSDEDIAAAALGAYATLPP